MRKLFPQGEFVEVCVKVSLKEAELVPETESLRLDRAVQAISDYAKENAYYRLKGDRERVRFWIDRFEASGLSPFHYVGWWRDRYQEVKNWLS